MVINEEAGKVEDIKMEEAPAVMIESIPTPAPPRQIKKITSKPNAKVKKH